MLDFSILGPIEVRGDGGEIKLAGSRQRALLALLLLRSNRVVPTDFLIDTLWGEQPPRTATTSLQNLIVQLRKLFGGDVIVTRSPGYLLQVEPEQLDLARFERLVVEAENALAPERSTRLAEALALWRGPPLADLAFEGFFQGEIRRLEELRLSVLEQRIAADLQLGRGARLIPELEALVGEHPLREGLCGQLMLALCSTGRQGEALGVYHDLRGRVTDELGIDPSPALQQTYLQIIRQEAVVFGGPPAPQPVDDHHGEIVKALLAGRVVPVLGWGASLAENASAELADPSSVAAHLCRVFECRPDGSRDLARVCEEVALTAGVGPLYDELRAIFDAEHRPGSIHRVFAETASMLRDRGLPQQVIVTTSFGTALEQAFADVGAQLDVVSYIAFGRHQGKFLHVAQDGSATVVELPNAYTGLSLDERTVVLKIHGSVDRLKPELDSFVVSEDDHIDYLAQAEISSLIPVTVVARLRRSHFLFLGYPLQDWGLRVFFHRIWGRDKVSYRSWAVNPTPEPIERELWRQRGVLLLDLPLESFAQGLSSRLLEAAR
jgi:DNA-binding SARP family transcriptional activator